MKKLTKILTENYPLLWASQLVKMLVLFIVALALEYLVVLFIPISASALVVLVFPVVLFLGIIIYRTIQQNKYFDDHFSFKKIYALYILNLLIIILVGALIFSFGYFMQAKTNKIVDKNRFDEDITIMRISQLDYENIRMLKTILLYPDTRATIIRNQAGNSILPLSNNDFITGYLGHNKPLYSFFLATNYYNSDGEEKYYSSHDLNVKIASAESAPPDSFDLSKYDTGTINIDALKIITRLNEKTFDTLRTNAAALFEKYGVPNNIDYEKTSTVIGQVNDNSTIIDYYTDPQENILFLFLLFVVIDIPVISIIAGLGRRYRLNFKAVSFPLSYFSFIVHVILTVGVFLIFFDLFGNADYYAFLTLMLVLFICYVVSKAFKLNVYLRSFFTQLLHYQLVYLLPVLFYLSDSDGIFSSSNTTGYIALYASNVAFILLLNIYFFKQYYKLSYLPLK